MREIEIMSKNKLLQIIRFLINKWSNFHNLTLNVKYLLIYYYKFKNF